jgi:hypothetical protein
MRVWDFLQAAASAGLELALISSIHHSRILFFDGQCQDWRIYKGKISATINLLLLRE